MMPKEKKTTETSEKKAIDVKKTTKKVGNKKKEVVTRIQTYEGWLRSMVAKTGKKLKRKKVHK